MKQRLLYTLAILFVVVQTFAQSYTYDSNNRLTEVVYDDGTTVTYTYDALGNRIEETVTGGLEDGEAYAWLSSDGKTLTFCYDFKRAERNGTTYDLNPEAYWTPGWFPGWDEPSTVSKLVFDPLFANARPKYTSYWFVNMKDVTEIEGLKYLNTSNVESMYNMFHGCSSLKSIDLSHFDTSNVTQMGQMFDGCSSLTNLDLRHFDTSNVKEMNFMFSGCSNLISIDLSNWDTSKLQSSGGMFWNCSSLSSLSISATMSNIDKEACYGVGTYSSPCTIIVPKGFNFGVDVSGNFFEWKGGYFTSAPIIPGDINGDNVVNAADIVELVKHLKGEITLSHSVADVNGDGEVNDADLKAIGEIIMNAEKGAVSLIYKLIKDMVTVNGGTFTMGATDGYGYDDERPVHEVTLSSFRICRYEVTQNLWVAVMGNNPSTTIGDNLPVNNISWNDCQVFIQKLNTLASSFTNNVFCMPTEAQWEFAARGGSLGKDLGTGNGYQYAGGYNNKQDMESYVWCSDNSDGTIHNVGTKKPNELRIYDMSGNVCEYVQDYYSNSYSEQSQTNPSGVSSGDMHVFRGGSYDRPKWQCRLASRFGNNPDQKKAECGLRLVLPVGVNVAGPGTTTDSETRPDV